MRGRTKVFALVAVLSLGLILPAQSVAGKINMPTYFTPTDVERCLPKFISVVSEVTDGAVDIKPFPINALIPIKDYLEATRRGAVKVSLFPEGYYEKQVPVSTIASGLPFACRDLDEARYFMREKGFVDLLRKAYLKLGVYIIPYETYRVGLMTNKPITKMDDFKGMKLRSYGPFAEWLMKMGASTIYIPGGELYTALSTGVVEGAHWGDAGPMYVMRFHEVLKNYMVPEPVVSWASLAFNLKFWESLTPLQRTMIETAAMGCGNAVSSSATRILGKSALHKMVDEAGVTVNVLPEEEVAKMQAASVQVWDEVAQRDELCAQGIDLLKGFMKELGYMK